VYGIPQYPPHSNLKTDQIKNLTIPCHDTDNYIINKTPAVNKMNFENKNAFDSMKELMGIPGLTLPPNSFVEMQGKYLDYKENEYIKISFPVQEKYCNPAGFLLGGMIPAFFDNTFGPLSYLAAKKPTTSLDLNTTFIKTISPADGELFVEGRIVKMTKRFIIFEGKAYNPDNQLIATCTSRMMILGN